jgi:hypothetical protein
VNARPHWNGCLTPVTRRMALLLLLALHATAALANGVPAFSNKEIGFDRKPPNNPEFSRPRADVLGAIKTVGVMPVDAGNVGAIPGLAEAVARMEAELVARLTAAGFKVVPPAEIRRSREVAAAASEGAFDPMTGKADPWRMEQYQQHLWKDYRSRNAVDGYVMSAIVVRQATESAGGSVWDGVTDSTTGLGPIANFVSGSKRQMAVMPAVSLAVWLTDRDFRAQYSAAGGLHLLMYLRKQSGSPVDYVEVAVGPEMFGEQRVTRAMDIIFEPIMKSATELALERVEGKKKKPRYSLKYAPALGDRAPDGSEFISPADFRAGYKSVLVAPLQWSNPARDGAAADGFEKLIVEKVTALGKTVIPPQRLLDALKPYAQSPQPLYDTRTGSVDRTAFETIRTAAFVDLAR